MRSTNHLQRHQILLYPGDYERLGDLYATKSAAEVIRTLVRIHIEQVEEKIKEMKHV